MNAPRSGCPINLTLEALGDRWSLIVIRDLMFGNRRHFRELLTRSEERIASNILAHRLRRWRTPDWYPVATIRALDNRILLMRQTKTAAVSRIPHFFFLRSALRRHGRSFPTSRVLGS
jgi:HxlR-like helix-turn-helix